VCAIVSQLCAALAEAHRRGVVHRDIKPANCFLVRTPDGSDFVKLLDLGLAKLLPSDRGLARAPQGAAPRVVGTPEYMSPEQALGRALDHRVDIYALGVTMYKLLTGRLPFAGSPPGMLLRRHIGETPRPPREVAPDIELPAALEAVVLRALAKAPEARFQGVGELAQALRAAQEIGEFELSEIVAEDVTVRAPVPRARRFETRRAAAGLGAAGLVLALAAIAVAIHVLRDDPPPAPPAAPAESLPKLSLETGSFGNILGLVAWR
jgi:serine/threonine-protein kinase